MPRPSPSALFAVLAVLLSAGAAGCDFEKVIEIDVPEYTERLVIGGALSTDSVMAVSVSRSRSAFETIQPGALPFRLSNARVAVYDEEGVLLDSLRYTGLNTGYHESRYRSERGLVPEAGRAYTLRVTAPGLPPAEATTRIPEPVPFTVRVDGIEGGLPSPSPPVARLAFAFADPPGAQTYALYLGYDDERLDTTVVYLPIPFESIDPVLRRRLSTLDDAVDLGLPAGTRRYYNEAFFRDRLIENQSYEIALKVPLRSYEDGTEEDPLDIAVTLAVLDADFVRYQQTLLIQEASADNPFAEPVRLHTNVEGGLGVFAGYATYRVRVPFE